MCQHILDQIELGTYAVKKLALSDDPDWRKRVFREVKALEYMHHPNIITYKHTWIEHAKLSDFGPEIPCLFMLMEYANFGNLDDVIWDDEKRLQISEEDLWIMLRELCKGIGHLHHHGICHRDVKPANILLHREKDEITGSLETRVLLTDFGQSEFLQRKDRLPRTGFTGTLLYAAPELLLKSGDFDFACDIYSLGAVLFSLSYGKAPFQHFVDEDDTISPDMFRHRLMMEPVEIPQFPERSPEFKDLLLKMLHFDAKIRPSADALLVHPRVSSISKNSKPTAVNGNGKKRILIADGGPAQKRRPLFNPRFRQVLGNLSCGVKILMVSSHGISLLFKAVYATFVVLVSENSRIPSRHVIPPLMPLAFDTFLFALLIHHEHEEWPIVIFALFLQLIWVSILYRDNNQDR